MDEIIKLLDAKIHSYGFLTNNPVYEGYYKGVRVIFSLDNLDDMYDIQGLIHFVFIEGLKRGNFKISALELEDSNVILALKHELNKFILWKKSN